MYSFSDVEDDCAFAPCTVLGTDLCRDLESNYTCVCRPGYTGRYCQTGRIVYICIFMLVCTGR